jgi:hypothetical protein
MTRVTRLIAVAGSSLAVAATLAGGAQAGERPDHRAAGSHVVASVRAAATPVSPAGAAAQAHRWRDARIEAGIAIAFVLLMVRPQSGDTAAAMTSAQSPSPTGELA